MVRYGTMDMPYSTASFQMTIKGIYSTAIVCQKVSLFQIVEPRNKNIFAKFDKGPQMAETPFS